MSSECKYFWDPLLSHSDLDTSEEDELRHDLYMKRCMRDITGDHETAIEPPPKKP